MSDIPTVAVYRGQKIHGFQSKARIQSIVVPEIDAALELAEPCELHAFLADQSRAPEARLVAARRLLEPVAQAERDRRRVPVNRENVEALTAGLDALQWADPESYGSLLLVPRPGDPPPALRPPEYRWALEAASHEA